MLQKFVFCKYCGKQVLKNWSQKEQRWIYCEPLVIWFTPAGGPETFITPEGKRERGTRAQEGGQIGYRTHRCKEVNKDVSTIHRGGGFRRDAV